MAKRKAEDAAEGSGPSKSKKPAPNAKQETAPVAIARLEKAGKEYKNAHEGGIDNRSEKDLDSAWLETLAQHIVREADFLSIMSNRPNTDWIICSKKWPAKVHLPRRYHRFDTYEEFHKKWFKKHHRNVIERAVAIYDEVIGSQQTSIEKTKILPPPDDDEASELRTNIFLYQILRTRMTAVLQAANDQEYILFKRVFPDDKSLALDSEACHELERIDAMKQEIREEIEKCKTDTNGRNIIDNLLNDAPPSASFIFELPDDTVDNGLEEDQATPGETTTPAEDNTAMIAAIDQKYPTNILFYDNEKLGAPDAATISMPRINPSDMDPQPQIDRLNAVADFQALDKEIWKALDQSHQSIDKQRFEVNLAHFESISQRPDELKNAKPADGIFTNVFRRLPLVDDNLFHVKVLIAQLRKYDLLNKDVTDEELQTCLRRMWALVAIMYGCVQEGSLWLTVMDRLLEDLARLLHGQIDPRLNTTKMRALTMLDFDTDESAPILSIDDINSLERSDLARRLFAELARFYRGAIILSYSGVSFTGSMNDKTAEQWYKNLICWSYVCGAEGCVEKLAVHNLEDIKAELAEAGLSASAVPGEEDEEEEEEEVEEDEVDEDAMDIDPKTPAKKTPAKKTPAKKTPAKKQQKDRNAIGSRSKFGVSVGVEDVRMGFPDERAEISKNRQWAYPCLYEFIHFNKWHPGFGPFFHYFGHLYHAPCQPTRGKNTFSMTVNAVMKAGRK